MRVTANTFANDLVVHLGRLSQRQNLLQSQAATGQRIRNPSDDPDGLGRVLDLQQEGRSLAQYQRNISTLKEGAQISFTVLQGLKRISDRAGEIAVLAGGVRSREEMQAYAAELDELIKQAVQLANTRHRDDFLLAGTRSQTAPFQAQYDPQGNVLSVTYQGNTDTRHVEIAEGLALPAATPGANSSGAGPRGLLADSRTGADFFAHLLALRDHLKAADSESIRASDLPHLKADEENFIYHLAANGVFQARLDTAQNLARSRLDGIEKLVSQEADADLAQTLVRLNTTQTAYQAALQTGGLILRQSLLDYLR
ncbi:MAG: flagellar hook-associated protein FlgL [Verrucomicrobiae bacterium]|nr:flagellar hook-associated protein FlgL [Verrucomicrobiae bacterium]